MVFACRFPICHISNKISSTTSIKKILASPFSSLESTDKEKSEQNFRLKQSICAKHREHPVTEALHQRRVGYWMPGVA